ESSTAPFKQETLVAMVLAERGDELTSAEGPPSQDLSTETIPFVDVQQYLSDLGLPVPAIEYVDLDLGVLLLEDLGDETFEDVYREVAENAARESNPGPNSEIVGLYRGPIDLLVDAQSSFLADRHSETRPTEEACVCWRRTFDRETLRWELDHYREWGLSARRDDRLDGSTRTALDEQFDRVVDALRALPTIPVFRDYQSRNLMRSDSTENADPWVLIDFQDALVGPFVYDLVSLLRDSYVELETTLVSRLVQYYTESGQTADLPWCDAPGAVSRAFHLQTIQRKLKDAGRFVFLDREKNNPDFLQYYDRSVRYVDRALGALEGWGDLRELLHEVEPSLD
ncbi:MAG: phosphotransferase, partial [Bradymonadaceae bacterium]